MYEHVGSVLSADELLDEEYEFPVTTIYRFVAMPVNICMMWYSKVACVNVTKTFNLHYRCRWVKINGDEYKISFGVITDVKHDLPVVGVIRHINLVNGNKVMFSINEYSTSFEPHFRAYILDNDPFCSRTVCHNNLFIQTPVYIHISCIPELSHSFIVLPFALCVSP